MKIDHDWIDNEYHIGDIVEIIETGHCYDRYDSWAKHHGIPNWSEGNYTEKGMTGTVLITGPHNLRFIEIYEGPQYVYQIVAIRLDDEHDVLMGNEGIKLISRELIEDELFEI